MSLFAQIISVLSNPMAVSIPMSFALAYRTSGDYYYSVMWTIITFFFVFLGGLFVLLGVKIGLFSDFDISKREERPPIFLFAGLLAILYFITVFMLGGSRILLLSSGGLLAGILLDSIINRKIKASVHLAVYSSFAFSVGILYGGYLWLFLLLIPLVAWSRLKLKRHTLAETIIGTTLGVSLVMVVYLVIQYFYYGN